MKFIFKGEQFLRDFCEYKLHDECGEEIDPNKWYFLRKAAPIDCELEKINNFDIELEEVIFAK